MINLTTKILLGLGALATAGVSSFFTDKYLITKDEMQAMIENGVRNIMTEENHNLIFNIISGVGHNVTFVLNSIKDFCVTNPLIALGASLLVYFGYKFNSLFGEYFSNVSKKMYSFFFGDPTLTSTEILEKGTLKAVDDVQKLMDAQQKFSKEMGELLHQLITIVTDKLNQTANLIEVSNNGTSQLVSATKTLSDEAFKSLKQVVNDNVTLLTDQTTLLINLLDKHQLELCNKLKTMHEINCDTRHMTIEIAQEVLGNQSASSVQVPVQIREVHDQGTGPDSVVRRDQGIATDNINVVHQTPEIVNVGDQQRCILVNVGDVQADHNQLESLRVEYLNSLSQSLEQLERPSLTTLYGDDDMTLEEVNNIPLPFLPDSDSSPNSVLESFDWSLMCSNENIFILSLFFGLLFYICMKKNKFYGIYEI